MTPQPITIQEWQSFFATLFRVRNQRAHDQFSLMCALMSKVSAVRAAVDGKQELNTRALAGIGGRVLSLANHFEVALASELYRKHPGYCTRCCNTPCTCERVARLKRRLPSEEEVAQHAGTITLQGYAQALADIYGPNNARNGISFVLYRVMEEGCEVCRAFDDLHKHEVAGELADVFAWWLGALDLLGIKDVQRFMWEHYPGTCAHCYANPCTCP